MRPTQKTGCRRVNQQSALCGFWQSSTGGRKSLGEEDLPGLQELVMSEAGLLPCFHARMLPCLHTSLANPSQAPLKGPSLDAWCPFAGDSGGVCSSPGQAVAGEVCPAVTRLGYSSPAVSRRRRRHLPHSPNSLTVNATLRGPTFQSDTPPALGKGFPTQTSQQPQDAG